MTKRIFIVGHMGAGKFIFTEALAKKLGWQIVDANPSIERYIGRQTRDILGEQGEAAFNRCQADIISHCIEKENVVVLLEECVVSSEQCRKLLSSEFVVYLKVSIPTQLGRMKNGRVPSLPVEDMESFLEKQHRERDAFYEAVASLLVESVGYSDQVSEINKIIDEDVNTVMKALGK
jgi:shikimate kinase